MYMIIISAVWIVGYVLAFVMQRTEIAAEKQPYTFGDRLLIASLSLLSWLWVIVVLVAGWCKGIAATGYWGRTIAKEEEPVKPEAK